MSDAGSNNADGAEEGSAAVVAPPPPAPPPVGPPPPAPVGAPPAGAPPVVQPLGRPPALTAPLWLSQEKPRVMGWRFWLALALGAVGADIAVRNPPWNNVGATLGVLFVVVALLLSGRVTALSSRVAVGLAAVLGLFLGLRTNPALVAIDLIAIVGLVWVAVVHNRGRSLWDTTPLRLLIRVAGTLGVSVESIPDVISECGARRRKIQASGGKMGDTAAAIIRGAVIAIPLLVILGLLLASADAVFASFFRFEVGNGIGIGVGHVVLLAIGAAAMAVLLRVAARDLSTSDERSRGPRLGLVETMVVLISLDALFAVFGIAQLVALSGSADRVLQDAGLTVKEHAREGFFQLLWVAGLAALVLIVMNVVSRHHERGRTLVRGASLVAIGLTFVIVAVAYSRLQLYIDFDGHTPLRFYSSVFSLWIALVFLILATRIMGVRSERNWFTAAVGCSAVVFLVALNIVNPEAVIARENLARNDGQILWHMDRLSADGNVALAEGIDQLPPDVRQQVITRFCSDADFGETERGVDGDGVDERRADYDGLRSNLAESRLNEAFAELCVGTSG